MHWTRTVMVAAMMCLASCHEPPTFPASNPSDTTPRLMALIDGLSFRADQVDYSLSTSEGRLRINGVRATATGLQQVTIDLAWQGAGTYQLLVPPASASFGFVENSDATGKSTGWWRSNATGGVAEITSYNPITHWIAGTFSFQATRVGAADVITVTQGTFAGMHFFDP